MILKDGEKLYGLSKILYDVLSNYGRDNELLIKFESKDYEENIRVFDDDEIELRDDYLIHKRLVDNQSDYTIIEIGMFLIFRIFDMTKEDKE